ncbi:LysR family transcriptional regulator [Qingshengfaniella alkalisoli]|uniref:HTH-type transcriptional regulator MetR n=1 Tax=Qingshengfaniella alkalisoli TaxID=2599296 RepID=A0A5B8IYT1_9RHOB|nr:LysR family transcriptional regulator [Qingshengfaniella alkalisoli]QDY70733.1 LysR family transcriptional regulator [Qingshengfaniella alkalisoli]
MIDLQPLAILREIDRTGSLTLAADKLHLTQSAVSHAMRRFEERHSVTVWTREGRGVRLTHAGRYLLGVAQRILPQLDHAETVLADFAEGRRGALRVGMECHPCQQWLMQVVTPYLATWPAVDLDVTTAFQFGGLAALLGHEIDLLVTPDPIERPGLQYLPVFDYELVLAVPDTHPLAGKRRVAPDDLTDEVLVTYPVPRDRLDIFTRFLVPGGVLPRRHRTVETTDLMLQLVASGRGVSAIPDWLLAEAQGVQGLRIGDGIFKSIHLGMRNEDQPDYITGFLDIAQATAVWPRPSQM